MPKQRTELSFQDATEYIDAFFEGDTSLIETFVAVYRNMFELDNEILIRTNGEIIGTSKPGEFYRFYVSNVDGKYYIKYKDRSEKELFSPNAVPQYFSYNATCLKYFAENKESLKIKPKEQSETKSKAKTADNPSNVRARKEKTSTLMEWEPIRVKCYNATEAVEKQIVDTTFSETVYNDILKMLFNICDNKDIFDERNGNIVKIRILSDTPVTLHQLGEMYGVSRERIRQCELKAWRKVTNGIYKYTKEQWVPYREYLKELLMYIPDEKFLSTIGYINKRNSTIGTWLQMIVSIKYQEDAIQQSHDEKLDSPSSTKRISSEAIEQIKSSIDIVEYISSVQGISKKGSNYYSVCPLCGAVEAFTVFPKTSSFYCFACGVGGDVITYLMKTQELDYKSAVQELASIADVDLTEGKSEKSTQLMRDAAIYYHNQLKVNPKAKSAIDILHSWGIFGKTIVQLGIGFHDNSFNVFIDYMTKEKGYTLSQLETAKLILKSSRGNYCDKMRNSIIIPTIDKNGKVVCFDFFITDKQQLYKYPNTHSFERSHHLYSYNLAIQANNKSVLIVSDYQDYFKLAGKGICNLVSTYLPRMTSAQLDLLKQKFKVIILLVPTHFNTVECRKYCQENNMYCDSLDLMGCGSVSDYIDNHEQDIIDKINEYERLLT